MKTLRTAAIIVGAVALVATGIGAAGAIAAGTSISAGIAGAGIAGVSAATLTTISGVLAAGSSLLAKKPKTSASQGQQSQLTIGREQPIPYAMGRTGVAGTLIHRMTWDHETTKNRFLTYWSVLSGAGPIDGIEKVLIDGTQQTFTGDTADGFYHDFMWHRSQLGACPEPDALIATGFYPYPAGWSASAKLSGMAADSWTMLYDPAEGHHYTTGVPKRVVVLRGVKVYDPRLDSTYPGGSGSCRAGIETTYVYSANPALHGLTWCLGRWQNSKKALGVGAPIDGIDVPSFVAAANIADANGWVIGGQVLSSDDPWQVLKVILQAGGAEPSRIGALISCSVNAPKVALATLNSADVRGSVRVSATQGRRDRFNSVIPRYRSETHDFEVVSAEKIAIGTYVTEDGTPRTREIELPLVPDKDQAAELAVYEAANSREFGPISIPCGLRWFGYKPGDCINLNAPEANLVNQPAIITNRSLDPGSGIVTLTLRSETAAKHDFALGRTATAPPTPALQSVDPTEAPSWSVPADWPSVIDSDPTAHPKPQDGATVGAPAGTYVAGVLAQQVVSRLVSQESVTAPSGLIFATIAGIQQQVNDAAAAGVPTYIVSRIETLEASERQGNPNLLINPDFADNLNSWIADSNWIVVKGYDVGNFAQCATVAQQMYQDVNVSAGGTYSVSAEMSPDETNGIQVYVDWLNSSGGVISNAGLFYGAGWSRSATAAAGIVAPSSAVKARVRVRQNAGTNGRITRVQFQRGAPATAFRNDASDRYNYSRLTSEIDLRTNQIGTYSTKIETLESQMAGTGDSALKSSITTAQTTAAAAYNGTPGSAAATVAQQVTTIQSSINALNSPNLLNNPSFNSGGLSGWYSNNSSAWGVVTAYTPTFAQYSTGYGNGYIFQDVTGIEPGKTYSMSFECQNSSNAKAYMAIQWFNGGSYLYENTGSAYIYADWGTRLAGGSFAAPAGATMARVVVYTYDMYGAVRIARVQFQKSNSPTPYNDGASFAALQAQVSTQAGTLATVQGKLAAYWQTEAVAGGYTAFITARADYNGNVGTSDVAIGAKVFIVYNPSGNNWLKTLEVSGGNVRVYGNLQLDGSVKTSNLQDNSVSKRMVLSSGSQAWNGDGYGGAAGSDQALFEVTLPLTYTADVGVRISGQHGFFNTNGSKPWRLAAYLNGQLMKSVGGAGVYTELPFCEGMLLGAAAGSPTLQIVWSGDASMQLSHVDAVVDWSYK